LYPERSYRKYQAVKNFVKRERKKRGMTRDSLNIDCRPEPSCIAYGEGRNLVECQLIPTDERYNMTWELLRKNSTLLNLAYNYAVYGIRG